MSIADKLRLILNTKKEIKTAINEKGVELDDSVKFRDYPQKIREIVSGGGGSGGEDFNINELLKEEF